MTLPNQGAFLMRKNEVYIMDNFKVIYKILKIIEKSMDLEEFDKENISKERFELSEPRYRAYITEESKLGLQIGKLQVIDQINNSN